MEWNSMGYVDVNAEVFLWLYALKTLNGCQIDNQFMTARRDA
jgi:hypothetical protein